MYRKIVAALEAHHFQYTVYSHEHIHTSADAARVRGTSLEEAAKAIVLKCGSGKLVQCIVSGHRRIDLKKLKTLLGEKNVALASPEEVLSATSCTIGSVPPFGAIFEPPMPVYADLDVLSREHLVFSAGTHYRSIRMLTADWKHLVCPVVVDVGREAQ